MKTEIIVHAPDFAVERESIDIIIEKNLQWKIDTYIKKHTKPDSVVRLELTLKRANEKQASGKLSLLLEWKPWRSERENFDNVHDLVNHLFTHLKEQLAK